MDLPISFQNVGGIAVLLLIIGLLVWMHFRRPQSVMVAPKGASLGLAYEWSLTPLNDAKKDLRARFPELERVVAEERTDDVHLIRFGLFNMTEEIIESEQIVHPVELTFPEGTTILSALYGEALKTERYSDLDPAVDAQIVTLPVQRMNPKSTLIFNFISRGGVRTLDVRGKTDKHGAIKRVG